MFVPRRTANHSLGNSEESVLDPILVVSSTAIFQEDSSFDFVSKSLFSGAHKTARAEDIIFDAQESSFIPE